MDEFELDDDGDDMPTAPFWMSTFCDMATLLLTFFVLIVSMSEVEVQKFKQALTYFKGSTSVLEFTSSVPNMSPAPSQTAKDMEAAKKQAEQFEELLRFLKENDLETKVQVDLVEKGIHVTITDSVMFASGSAVLLPGARHILVKLSDVLAERLTSVRVEGHTDDRPIRTATFPSNWELSAARAASVVRFFLEQETAVAPADYTAIGHGEFHPVASNATAAGRAKNRRVEILFASDHGR